MAYREVFRMEIQEIIRRWQGGMGRRQIAAGTGLSRNTVRRYLSAAESVGIAQEGPAPTEEQLVRLVTLGQSGPRRPKAPRQDELESWADQIYQWRTGDRLMMTRIHELLAARGCRVSYTSLQRFVAKRNWRKSGGTTVRMADTPPGEVAEADFGRLGMVTDPAIGKRKAVGAKVIVLCHSRHCFVWPMQHQRLEDVIAGLEAAWAFFDGMPKYLVIDNVPAAVAGVDPLHPRFTQEFLEYAQHQGFIPDPARKSHPQDKPKVERGVPYVRERFFQGADLDDLGLHRLTSQQSADLYELILNRHRASSFVITSNRAVDEWLSLFDDPILGNSALDRLANASYQIIIEGTSYREAFLLSAPCWAKEVIDRKPTN